MTDALQTIIAALSKDNSNKNLLGIKQALVSIHRFGNSMFTRFLDEFFKQ